MRRVRINLMIAIPLGKPHRPPRIGVSLSCGSVKLVSDRVNDLGTPIRDATGCPVSSI